MRLDGSCMGSDRHGALMAKALWLLALGLAAGHQNHQNAHYPYEDSSPHVLQRWPTYLH